MQPGASPREHGATMNPSPERAAEPQPDPDFPIDPDPLPDYPQVITD